MILRCTHHPTAEALSCPSSALQLLGAPQGMVDALVFHLHTHKDQLHDFVDVYTDLLRAQPPGQATAPGSFATLEEALAAQPPKRRVKARRQQPDQAAAPPADAPLPTPKQALKALEKAQHVEQR